MYIDNLVQSLQYFNNNPNINVEDISGYFYSFPKVVFIAIGKSYLACKLAVGIANSYGLNWQVIDGGRSLHGDLGIISSNNLVVLVSKSGKTQELIEIGKRLPNKKFYITLTSPSPLSTICDDGVNIPLPSEASHISAVPSTSSVLTAVLLIWLANEVAKLTNVSAATFYTNHPGGSIGTIGGLENE